MEPESLLSVVTVLVHELDALQPRKRPGEEWPLLERKTWESLAECPPPPPQHFTLIDLGLGVGYLCIISRAKPATKVPLSASPSRVKGKTVCIYF